MTYYHQTTITHSYWYSFFSFFGITSLWMMYLQQQGLSLVEIGLCESVFHLASFLFEVPSGVLADRFSYKTVLIAGRVLALLSAIVMLIGGSFWVYALGFVLNAFSYNLQSGTLEALLYDSLLVNQNQHFYPKVVSRLNIILEFADTSGVVLAGFLVHWHFGLTYGLEIIVSCLALFAILGIKDPPITANSTETAPTPASVRKILHGAWKLLKQQPQLRRLMIFQALFDAVCTSYYFYFQTLMESHHFVGWLISLLLIGASVINMGAIYLAPHLQAKLSMAALVRWLATSLLVLVTCWFNQIAILLVIFLMIQAITSLSEPIFSTYYNKVIPSAQRATLLSVASVFFSISMILVFPLIGWLTERVSFASAFGSLGVALMLLLVAIALRANLRRKSSL